MGLKLTPRSLCFFYFLISILYATPQSYGDIYHTILIYRLHCYASYIWFGSIRTLKYSFPLVYALWRSKMEILFISFFLLYFLYNKHCLPFLYIYFFLDTILSIQVCNFFSGKRNMKNKIPQVGVKMSRNLTSIDG